MPFPWRRVCAVLVLGHLAVALARIPFDVIGKRHQRIHDYRAKGAVRFHLDTPALAGADAVEWILRHAPPDAVVLHRGAGGGAIEFVPPLIWPRLLYAEAGAVGERVLARPLAHGPIAGQDATAVLTCEPERRGQLQRLRIEPR